MRIRNWLVTGMGIAALVCAAGSICVASAAATEPSPGWDTGPSLWETDDGGPPNVINAQGCVKDTQLIEYPYNEYGSCNGDLNSNWYEQYTGGGAWAIYAFYPTLNDSAECFNVKGGVSYSSGTHVLAWQCGTPASNEKFVLSNIGSESCPRGFLCGGWYYIKEAADTSLCLNVQGGDGSGHDIILYGCDGQNDEKFYFDQ